MRYSKEAKVDPTKAAAAIQAMNPLAKLEHYVGFEGIGKTVTGDPTVDARAVEEARGTFISGIASVFHDEADVPEVYLTRLASKSMEAEDYSLARNQPMDFGIWVEDKLSRLAFIPVGTSLAVFDEYQHKLSAVAAIRLEKGVTQALHQGTFVGAMGLPGGMTQGLSDAIKQAPVTTVLKALGQAAFGPNRASWQNEMLVGLARLQREPRPSVSHDFEKPGSPLLSVTMNLPNSGDWGKAFPHHNIKPVHHGVDVEGRDLFHVDGAWYNLPAGEQMGHRETIWVAEAKHDPAQRFVFMTFDAGNCWEQSMYTDNSAAMQRALAPEFVRGVDI